MFRSNIYPKLILLVSFVVLGFTSSFAQTNLEMKLQLMNDTCWGVYVTPVGVSPTTSTTTASGQVSIVMPDGFNWENLTSESGQWINNATVFAPSELSDRQVVSFGLVQAEPLFPIQLTAGEETLLFTFCSSDPCPDSLYLIDCTTALASGPDPNVCPFCPEYDDGNYPNNSEGTNPGNDLGMLDFGVSPAVQYNYQGNYAPSAWSCHDCDGDGIPNGLEDTNGDGSYTPGVDTSALCDPCDPYHIQSATLDFISDAQVICAGDIGDTAYLVVDIVNITGSDSTKYDGLGWDPFMVVFDDGSGAPYDTIFNYASGDSIPVVPSGTETYQLITVLDSFLCSAPDSLFGMPTISVEGPLSFTTQPSDVTECSEDANSFTVVAANAGDGTIEYNWQTTADTTGTFGGTVGFTTLDGSAPFNNVYTPTLNITEVAGLNGTFYRSAIFTEYCDTVYSEWAELTVDGPISVTASPADITVCDGGTVTFTGAGQNLGVPGTMLYKWQESQDGGTSWADVSGGIFSDETTTTVTLTGVDVSMDGYQYRMGIYTPTCDTIFTLEAVLDVQGPLTFTNHPDDFSNCAGAQVFFNFEYDNPGGGTINYQWQQSCDGGATWTDLVEGDPYNGTNGVNNVPGTGDTLSIADVIGLDSCIFRVGISSSTCATVYSNSAQLDVSGNATFTSISADDLLVCHGADTIIVACAEIPQGDFFWTWEFSNDNGVTWDSLEMGVGGAHAALFSQSSGGASMTTGCDTLQISDVSGMYDYKFRAIAQADDCDGVISEEVQLRVEGPLSVTTQPLDTTECAGNPTTFVAVIANPGFSPTTFQWQISVNSGVTWTDLSNNPIYGGVNTSTLIIADVTGMDQYQFRLQSGSGTCTEIVTSAATLTVEGPILYSQADDPQDVTLCYDDSFSFTSAASLSQAGTIEYQWQVSSDDGVNWTDIGAGTDGGIYTDYDQPTLIGSSAAGLYDRCYRLAFTTGKCSEVYSNMACLTVQGEITVTDQPDDITECSGDPVTFMIQVDDASTDYTDAQEYTYIQFLWQESTNGGASWSNLADGLIINGGSGVNGVNTDTLLVTETAGRDGNLFRALVFTEFCDTVYSDPATFFIEGPVSFIDDPDNISECSGSGVTFTAATQNPGLGTVEYQWEISYDDGTSWYNVSNGTVNGFSGVDQTTLIINDVVDLYDERFRLKAWTQYCDTLYSNYAVLSVEGPISFTDEPDDQTICSGEPACFSVETLNSSTSAISSPIQYQWQMKVNNTTNWLNLPNNSTYNGVTTANMCVSDVAGLDSAMFRVLIQTDNCASISSDSALLAVEGPISFTAHPQDVTQCSSEEVYFTATSAIAVGNSGTMSYLWQTSPDGINWSNMSDGGINSIGGATTDSLTIGDVSGLHDTYYRLSVTTGVCSEVYSFDARLAVEGPLAITQDPVSFTNCDDKEAIFISNVSNGALVGQDGIEFQWEISADGGNTWTEALNGETGPSMNLINGATTDTLLIAPLTDMNGYVVRMKTWTATCDTLTSDTAWIHVEGPLVFTDQPDDVSLCSDDATCFTVAVNNTTGVGSVSYQWEVSANGVIWSDVSNGATGFGSGMYSGATTNQLCVSEITGLYNYRYRCKVQTGECDWEFSQLAQLFVQGPIAFDAQPTDQTICDNLGLTIESTVSLPPSSSGALNFQWQENDGSGWVNINDNDNTGGGVSMYSNDVGTEQGEYFGVNTDDLNISLSVGMDGYQFRLIVWTTVGSGTGGGASACADTSNVITLTVEDACTTGNCDFDLDGQDNDTDTDDDNDLLADYWEDWMTLNNIQVAVDTFVGTGPWNYFDDMTPTPLLINYSNCDTDSDNDGLIDGLEDPDGDLLSNTEETDGDGIFDGNPLDPCHPILGPTCIGVSLAIDVNLQGAKINVSAVNPLMRDNLRANDTLPATEPYGDMASFTHVGDGGYEELSQSQAASIYSVTGDDAIVDWVFVELRSSTALDSIITTRSAFLQRDGDVVDIDGSSDLTFVNAPAGPYYVSVRHRNHLGVMSAEALDLSPITSEVDFTDPATPTYGDHAQIQLTDGEMYMWAGDVNQDGRTIYQGPGTDVFQIFLQVLSDPGNDQGLANYISYGYLTSDIDLDYDAVYQGPSNDRALLFFNTTLQHPENTDNLANYVILETLP